MTSGGIANHEKIDGNKCNSDKVGLHVQSSLLPRKYPPSSREPYSLDHLCCVEGKGGDVSGPQTLRRLPKNVSQPCGWRDDVALPSPSELCVHDSPSGVGNDNIPIPTGLPVANYLPSGIMVDRTEASQASGTRTHHRTKLEGSPCVSEPISTRRDRNVRTRCSWQNEDGRLCGVPVTHNNCAEHFAAVHEIKNIAAKVKVLCRWCALSTEKKVTRKNLLRHLREAHLHYPR
ncbi:hypothetical protein BKA82DRAFT_1002912 [Pisolithus tinctorius]|uniref:Uncharacterized protein n=1 Tax=Pisolithus tinctorius Marx 270 TaxID=870435 RepID=A0A0C3NLG7_PISTI|nr:hypothetical protein BKA82DRAFT_1002912 [Pisolithus tinctorius]KIO01795.1 hypothetical protein M404DRAFT_1002912 [Pisolithus tinctorius Marx 270]